MNDWTLRPRGWALPIVMFALASFYASSPTDAYAAAVAAKPAKQFVNSIGVASHFAWGNSVYRTQYGKVKAALDELGIHHIRDDVGNTAAMQTFKDLYQTLGVKLTGVVDTRTGSGRNSRLDPSGIQPELDRIKSMLGTQAVVALEGPNEYNILERDYGIKDWPTALRSFQGNLYSRVRSDPKLNNIPVIGPTMAGPNIDYYYSMIGNYSSIADIGGIHIYPNYLGFEEKADWALPAAAPSIPGTRFVVTETGYHTASNSGAQYVDEATAIKYLPRTMLSSFTNPQIARMFIYQLLDPSDNPAKTITGAHFGLMSYGLERKGRFYAVRNLMHVLCDSTWTFSTKSLNYTLTGDLADVRTVLLQKSNGAFYLVLWQERQGFEKSGQIVNAPQAATLKFNTNIQLVRHYLPADPTSNYLWSRDTPVKTRSNPTSIDLNIRDYVEVLEIVPAGVPVPKLSLSCDFIAS
ncbi:MAG: hypothetical protein IPK66_13895 [Rhodospirillales bacterium]|nr:hypothetical protein [Rhodospirillales bacterium]